MAENIREIILDTLLAIERGEEYSNQLVRSVLDKYNYLDVRDKSFFKRVTEGTVERKIELDYYLNQYSKVPVGKMKPLIRCLMRMSVYQLLYMDSVPDSAICNEACKLANKRKFTNLKGFVNGVLRNIARNKENLPLPDAKKNYQEYLSVKYSMPLWIVEKWIKEYDGEVTEKILEGLLEIHPVSIRFVSKLSEDDVVKCCKAMQDKGVMVEKNPYLSRAYQLTHVDAVWSLPGFAEGYWTVQDVSSMLAVEMAGIKKEDFVLDACAAPGGKTILAAEKAKKVLCRDVSEEKAEKIRENIERMQMDNIEVQVYDATVPDAEMRGKVDVLLLDVPCSGLGILGKKRDIKYNVTPESIKELNTLQKEIVRTCAEYVKPGGILLYSTCTINREENEEMADYIAKELGFSPVSIEESLPDALLTEKKELEKCVAKKENTDNSKCFLQFLPGYMQADGFFFAKFEKTN